jgi:1-acyl-sn-glycerol-3-phosphate acyltransferase
MGVARLARFVFFLLVVRPLVLVVLGLNVRHGERLPTRGPAILAANHNSHLDTMVLMTLFPWRTLARVRPVAAADYFLRGRLLTWFSRRVIGIIPIDRSGSTPRERLSDEANAALAAGEIVIVFPEGSRGEPERLARFKTGLYFLARANREASVVPVFLHGLGKALPKGEALLVPFFCDVLVGEPLDAAGERDEFMASYAAAMNRLAAEGNFPPWE